LTLTLLDTNKGEGPSENDDWELPKPSFKKNKLSFAGVVKKNPKSVGKDNLGLTMQRNNELVSKTDLRVTLMTNKRQRNDGILLPCPKLERSVIESRNKGMLNH
jgi:hypothetical protein